MAPKALYLEALSALVGCDVKSIDSDPIANAGQTAMRLPTDSVLTPQSLIGLVALKSLHSIGNAVVRALKSDADAELALKSLYGIGNAVVRTLKSDADGELALEDETFEIHLKGLYGIGKAVWGALEAETKNYSQSVNDHIRTELFVNVEDFFDPGYDFDFTNINDGNTVFTRGNEPYKRSCGWNRIALKVLNKYEDGNGWLGTGAHAWPVSYHGTSMDGAKGIMESHYKAGSREAYGRGVYSTPDIGVALGYSKTFHSKTTNKTYNVMLQNRINPKKRHICECDQYWLISVPTGTSAADEKAIVESSLRPYSLLLKEKVL